MLTPSKLVKLKAKLPRGYFSVIVDRVPYSERTVAKFFTGEVYKIEIHQACLALIQEEKDKVQSVAIQHKSALGHE